MGKKASYCKSIIVVMVCFIGLAACTGAGGTLDLRKPVSMSLEPPPGPPEYRQGWADGCETGNNSYTNTFYKLLRAFDLRFDPKLRNNKMYYQVWKDAFLFCASYWESQKRTPY